MNPALACKIKELNHECHESCNWHEFRMEIKRMCSQSLIFIRTIRLLVIFVVKKEQLFCYDQLFYPWHIGQL